MKNSFEKELSIAPMMKWTDTYCRFFHRQFSWLYSFTIKGIELKGAMVAKKIL